MFFSLDIIITAIFILYQTYRQCRGKAPIPLLWIPLIILVEMPLLVSEASLLKAKFSIVKQIDWHEEKLDILLHLYFIFDIPFQLFVDFLTSSKLTIF